MKRALLLAAILTVILFVTTGGPWSQFVGHSHWPLVEWVPFSGGVYPFDIVANVALFLPLGLTLAWRRGRGAVFVATLLGALLSISVEVYQVYTHGRIATITDVLTNTCGTALGASLAARGLLNISRGRDPNDKARSRSVSGDVYAPRSGARNAASDLLRSSRRR